MGKKKIWKKCPSSLDLLYHSTVCSFYINGSQDLLWIKLIQCFYVIVPTTFYFSLVSNWPWFLELFLCLLHLFTLTFGTHILCTNLDLASLVTLNSWIRMRHLFANSGGKVLLANQSHNEQNIFWSRIWILIHFILCWTRKNK